MGLEGWSDLQLKDAIQAARAEIARLHSPEECPDHHSVTVFAVVDECVRRRLGVWRYVTETGYEALLAQLTSSNREVLEAMSRAQEAGLGRFGPDTLVSASVYRALRLIDSDDHSSFIPTDEQVLAGLHLLENRVVEMRAGEGKTVAIALAAVMNAVLGRQVHIITANDYLADRDSSLLAPVYRALGFSVGTILESMDGQERKAAYKSDVVYGTLREFGFDYLRDNLAAKVEDRIQPRLVSAIVDEADQALIDESDTPLIIAGTAMEFAQTWNRVNKVVVELVGLQAEQANEYVGRLHQTWPDSREFGTLLCLGLLSDPRNPGLRKLARQNPKSYRLGIAALYPDGNDSPDETLTSEIYYVVDSQQSYVTLTDRGMAYLQARLGAFGSEQVIAGAVPAGTSSLSRRNVRKLDLANQVYQSLRAHLLLEAGVDYLVTEDSVTLLDAHTGRNKPDNLYQDGLQAALEAKEGVAVNSESESLAQISVQGFVSRYKFLSGITGTAIVASEEFRRRFSMSPVLISTSQSSQRVDLPSRIYDSDEDRLAAIVEEVARCNKLGIPVLAGTQTIEQSLKISRALSLAGIEHQTLNAVTNQAEADIIKNAGTFRAVTVATNMGGRGTDIELDSSLQEQLVSQCISLVWANLQNGSIAVPIGCNTAAECEILEVAFRACSGLQVQRRSKKGCLELLVHNKGENLSDSDLAETGPAFRFGLGLYVIVAEFSRFPRVSLQLQGRSGRQGNFGSTRQILCWDDRGLLGLGRGRPEFQGLRMIDDAGRLYFEGGQVDRFLRRRQDAGELEAANRRGIMSDYAAVSDAHAHSYRKMRRQFLEHSDLTGNFPDLAMDVAARLVKTRFPQMDPVDYLSQFEGLVQDVRNSYDIEIGQLQGFNLDQLPVELGSLIQGALAAMADHLPGEAFGRLARQLLLEAGDEVWREHQLMLRHSVFNSVAGNHGHKSSVADFIIHAAESWQQFPGRANDSFLSSLLKFPLHMVDTEPEENLDDRELSRQLAQLFIGAGRSEEPGAPLATDFEFSCPFGKV